MPGIERDMKTMAGRTARWIRSASAIASGVADRHSE
jgi:hypothetical protein